MKRNIFLKELHSKGCVLKRHGGRHDIYINTKSFKQSPIPRHPEIKNLLCKLIRKQLGII
ncbi:MAG: addiction module toxin, HicA family [Gammaproteobacteria bacterium]|nr:MAG: addiction module toxin, HicA family [Gammaproteobacteria bacterium]